MNYAGERQHGGGDRLHDAVPPDASRPAALHSAAAATGLASHVRSPLPACTVLLSRLSEADGNSISLTPLFYGEQKVENCFIAPYLHSSTQQFLHEQSLGNPVLDHEVMRLEIFTDGSGGSDGKQLSGPPAWAFVVMGYACDGRCRVEGYLTAPSPGLKDEFASPSGPSEFTAALWLVSWLLQERVRVRALPIIVHTDNIMVVRAAAGGTNYTACGALPQVLDGLVKLIRVHASLDWVHVPGHIGHPLNELADTIAKLSSIGGPAVPVEYEDLPWGICYRIWMTCPGSGLLRNAMRSLPTLLLPRLTYLHWQSL